MEAFNKIGIQHKKSGIIYLADGWDSRGFDPDEARGIALGDGEHSLCLYKDAAYNLHWVSDYSYFRRDAYKMVYNNKDAANDFSGKENTDAILRAVTDSRVIIKAPAAEWVRRTFGENAYLPAGGEVRMIMQYGDEIIKCFKLLGGNLIKMFNDTFPYIWTSTQLSESHAWFWDEGESGLSGIPKDSDYLYTLACTAL